MTFLYFLLTHVNLWSNFNHFFLHDGQNDTGDDHDELKMLIEVNQKDGDDDCAFLFGLSNSL